MDLIAIVAGTGRMQRRRSVLLAVGFLACTIVAGCRDNAGKPSVPLGKRSLPVELSELYSDNNLKNIEKQYGTINYSTRGVIFGAEIENAIRSGKALVPELMERLEDEDWRVRVASYVVLAGITRRSIGPLEDFRYDDRRQARRDHIEAWNQWWERHKDSNVLDWLADDLLHGDDRTKRDAITHLGELGDPKAIPTIRGYLQDDRYKLHVIDALGRLKDPCVMPNVVEFFLRSGDEQLRRRGLSLLQDMTGQTFGFDPKASDSAREGSLVKITEWSRANCKETAH